MADQQFDVNNALGESYEYSTRTILPESYYPVIVHVNDTGVSDPKTVPLKVKGVVQKDELGNDVMVPGGMAPFVKLTLDVYEGPFAGSQIERNVYITPGQGGGAIGRWLGACHAITGQRAQTEAICAAFGVQLPTGAQVRPEGKETPDQAFKRQVREALAAGFYDMDSAKRLAFIAKWLNVPAWDGKRAIVKLGLEGQAAQDGRIDPATGKVQVFYNNNVDGFLPLADEKKGLAWVKAVEFPKQAATKAMMEEGS